MSRIRTFVAIPIPAPMRKTLSAFIARLKPWSTNVRWLDGDHLHLTLVFLGDIEDSRVAAVCNAVKQVCAQHEPIEVTVAGVGAFPKPEKPRVIWAGIQEGSELVVALREAIASSLDEAQFQFDWRFTAHITLGRFGRGRFDDHALIEKSTELADEQFGEMLIDRVLVLSSTLEKQGPVYVPLATIPL